MKLKVTFTTTHTLGALSESINVPDSQYATIKQHLNNQLAKFTTDNHTIIKVKDIVLIEDIQ